MSVFSETIATAIKEYRQLLKRLHTKEEREDKIMQLRLNNRYRDRNDVSLYETAEAIMADIDDKLRDQTKGYYSYSGLENFKKYLSDILGQYVISGNRVVHSIQLAADALLNSVQLLCQAADKLNDATLRKLTSLNQTIAEYGSKDQCQQYEEMLRKHMTRAEPFFRKVLDNYLNLLYARLSDGKVESVG